MDQFLSTAIALCGLLPELTNSMTPPTGIFCIGGEKELSIINT
ncbi:hypothetical protein LEP1GSC188_4698 [Leptospira weilii serovar Topaz str. LT2116]|uniref:Uncharacterized protein n=1 Tax=Leptospira weilii serovar Topaz str. LT2116 TaxID=1088540 RepID=M3EMJ6_9LEPT|nr:hypothetical protein LEP1GSC188_4698 [Leptospira weilii serovar Topaz str. LT2116]